MFSRSQQQTNDLVVYVNVDLKEFTEQDEPQVRLALHWLPRIVYHLTEFNHFLVDLNVRFHTAVFCEGAGFWSKDRKKEFEKFRRRDLNYFFKNINLIWGFKRIIYDFTHFPYSSGDKNLGLLEREM